MTLKVKGLHHFTAICGDPTQNAKFYVNKLGLRMIKKTVNHDAPEYYHLFYGDHKGTPGSSITFFPNMANQQGKPGAGMITELALRIPENSLEYWIAHLEDEQINYQKQEWRGKETLTLQDPDQLQLRLVPQKLQENNFETWSDSTVPEEHQIQGMHHVKLEIPNPEETARLLEKMNFEEKEQSGSRENRYFEAEDQSGVELEMNHEKGRMGKGSVHHIAFKIETEEEQEKCRDEIIRRGLRPSPMISRKYFTSFYFREHNGILFEFSSMGPGYTADETVKELGSSLVLPEKLENRREEIEQALEEFNEEEINQ